MTWKIPADMLRIHGRETTTDPAEIAAAMKDMFGEYGLDSAQKFDRQKRRFDLVPVGPLSALADVYTFGAGKYADRNWEKGLSWGRCYAAALRHLTAFWAGENMDQESGLPHLAHAAWNCFALLEYMQTHPEMDDRPNGPEDAKDND